MAIVDACQQILQRLKPYRTSNPNGMWRDWVSAAYFDRVSLSASGFYRTPGIGYNFETNQGHPFNYFCYGAACSEVEIDCLTGDHRVSCFCLFILLVVFTKVMCMLLVEKCHQLYPIDVFTINDK